MSTACGSEGAPPPVVVVFPWRRRNPYVGAFAPSFQAGESTPAAYLRVRLEHVDQSAMRMLSDLIEAENADFASVRNAYREWVWEVKYEHRQYQRLLRLQFEEHCVAVRETEVMVAELEARCVIAEACKTERLALMERDMVNRNRRLKVLDPMVLDMKRQAELKQQRIDQEGLFLRDELRARDQCGREEQAYRDELELTFALQSCRIEEAAARQAFCGGVAAWRMCGLEAFNIEADEAYERRRVELHAEQKFVTFVQLHGQEVRFHGWQVRLREQRLMEGAKATRWIGEFVKQ